MTMALLGKRVLITGAASGIGREAAFSFAELGASLELSDIDEAGLERTAMLCRKLGAASGITVTTHRVDVASPSDMKRMAEDVHRRIDALDVLINNAGVGAAGSFVGTDLQTWNWAIDINLKGVIHGCHYFVPNMVERKRGHVVNVASLAGLVAARRMSVYATTKFAVVGFSEVLRAELEPEGIGVTTLCPGVIDTPITRTAKHTGDLAAQPEYRRASMEAYRQRRYGPQRVAAAIVEAVRENKGLLPVSPESWLFYYMKRFAPGVAARVLNHDSLQPKPKTAAS